MADFKEYRAQPSAEFEFRDESNIPVVEGYASTFMEPYSVGPFTEQIDPKAFNRSLGNKAEVPLLVDHEGTPLAHTKSGTMRLAADTKGLHIRAELDPANPKSQELISALRRGDLDKMSFAFRVPENGDVWEDNYTLRTIRDANIHDGDVSVVSYPANRGTSVGIRNNHAGVQAPEMILANAIFREARATQSLSPADHAKLMSVLHMVAQADNNVDQAQVVLADVLGVPNPDQQVDETVDPPAPRGRSLELSRRMLAALDL